MPDNPIPQESISPDPTSIPCIGEECLSNSDAILLQPASEEDIKMESVSYKLVGDPYSLNPVSLDLAEIIYNHIIKRSNVPDSDSVCVDACYQYFIEALKEIGVQINSISGFEHGYPSIGTSDGGTLYGLYFMKIFYSISEKLYGIDWSSLPASYRGMGPVGALYYGDLIENRTIITSEERWPNNLARGTPLQLWLDKKTFEEVRDLGKPSATGYVGHAPIFLGYKDDNVESDTIIVADQYHTSTEYKYPKYGFKYVIAGKPAKVQLIGV